MLVDNITIGADPELFIINTKTSQVVSAIGLIPGEKGNPYRSPDMPEGFGLEIDNILAEFNIPPVSIGELGCDDAGVEFIHNIEYMKNYIKDYVSAKDPNLGILCKASMEVPDDQLKDPGALEFGCDPDFNVYTGSVNPKPEPTNTNLRSAGFHIHIGYDNFNIDDSLNIVKRLDLYLGLTSVILDPDTKRRSLYGKAGCFRLTDYGVEYRVISSAMMRNTEVLRQVWDMTCNKALSNYYSSPTWEDCEEVRKIIDTVPKDEEHRLRIVATAKYLLDKYL